MAGFKFTLSRAERKVLRKFVTNRNNRDFHRICERAEVYANLNMGLVVKRPNFILAHNTPLKARVPTIKLVGEWVVQPIVERRDLRRALVILHKKVRGTFADLHRDNIGWWQGKAVMFDW